MHFSRCSILVTFCTVMIYKQASVYASQMESLNENEMDEMQDDPFRQPQVCLASECHKTAEEILKNLDKNTNPCIDFYQFACGNYLKNNSNTINRDYAKELYHTDEETFKQIKILLNEEFSKTDPKHFEIPKKFYKTCMNLTSIKELGIRAIEKVSNVLGGWPILKGDSWNSDNSWNWQETIKKLRALGLKTDYIFSTEIRFYGSRAMLSIYGPNENSMEMELRTQNYSDYIAKIANQFGASINDAVTQESIGEITQFIENLFEHTAYEYKSVMSVENLQSEFPYVNWLNYFNALLPENVQIGKEELITVLDKGYFEKLGRLLAISNNRTIANYLMFRIHSDISTRLEYEIKIEDEEEARPKHCVNMTMQYYPLAVASLYIQNISDPSTRSGVKLMVEDIRKEYSRVLHENGWLDLDTQQAAQNRLATMKVIIAYPDDYPNVTEIEEFYSEVNLNWENYFEAILFSRFFYFNYYYGLIRKTEKEYTRMWSYNPVVGRTSYLANVNTLVIKFADLTLPHYDTNRPIYLNYGGLGQIIGHKITHGIDYKSLKSVMERSIFTSIYWIASYKKQCFVRQYHKYIENLTGLNVNGEQTARTNIANSVGIKVAYRAYQKLVRRIGPQQKLPGADYTPKQLFWISAAQQYCVKYSKEYLEKFIRNDPHAPNDIAVNKMMSNNENFSEDFNCPLNSPMNPEKKCEFY